MNINPNGSVAAELRALMARKAKRQKDLAEHLNISTSALSARLNGKAPLTVDEVVAICLWLHADPASVLGDALEAAS